MNANSKITGHQVSATKRAALRFGIELTTNQAFNFASKIVEWMDQDDECELTFTQAANAWFNYNEH